VVLIALLVLLSADRAAQCFGSVSVGHATGHEWVGSGECQQVVEGIRRQMGLAGAS
jgi:hypothetical protein